MRVSLGTTVRLIYFYLNVIVLKHGNSLTVCSGKATYISPSRPPPNLQWWEPCALGRPCKGNEIFFSWHIFYNAPGSKVSIHWLLVHIRESSIMVNLKFFRNFIHYHNPVGMSLALGILLHLLSLFTG